MGDGAFLVLSGSAFGMLACEAGLWPAGLRNALAGALRPAGMLDLRTLAWAFGLVALGNTIWTLRIVLRHGSPVSSWRSGTLLAPALLATPPLLPLLVIPLWRRLGAEAGCAGPDRRPTGPASAATPLLRPRSALHRWGDAAASVVHRVARLLESRWVPILWLGPGNLLWVLVASAWLVAGAGNRAISPWFLLAATSSLHLLAYAAARVAALEPQLLAPSLRRRQRLELLWLLPSPLPQAWWLGALIAGLTPRRSGTLAHAALLGRGFPAGSPTGAHLVERASEGSRKRPVWRRWRRPPPRAADLGLDTATRRFLAVARWKVLGLAVDGFALASVAAAGGALPTTLRQPVPGWAWGVLAAAAVVLGSTVLLRGGQQFARYLQIDGFFESLDRLPYLRAVVWGQLCLALGFFWGVSAAPGDRTTLILALANGWALALMLATAGLFLNPLRSPGAGRREPSDLWFWPLSLTVAPLLTYGLVRLAATLEAHLSVAGLAVAASLAWSVAVVSAGRFALCHPLSVDHLRERSTPPGVRAALRFVLLTAALPFGGMLVPVWMALRERSRARMDGVATPPRRGSGAGARK